MKDTVGDFPVQASPALPRHIKQGFKMHHYTAAPSSAYVAYKIEFQW